MARFECNMISYVLRHSVDLTVVVPTLCYQAITDYANGKKPNHKPEHKYPVLYLLHGHGNDHATWTSYTNIEFFAEEHQIAVVMFSAENKAYINHPSGDNFFDFISVELPEFIKAMFPISERPEDTYIAGLSMGGYGTLVHALNFPERFCAFGAFSAGIRPRAAEDGGIDPRFDPYQAAKKAAGEGKTFPKAYLACGTRDGLYQSNVEFREELKRLGADVTWDEEDYDHEWRFWNLEVERFLNWIPRTDPYAGKKRRI